MPARDASAPPSRNVRTLIISCHPSPQSFTHAIVQRIAQGLKDELSMAHIEQENLYDTDISPLLEEEELRRKISFDPQVQRHTALVENSDFLIFVHPDWWGMPPALLVGWVDRVFRPEVAYEYREDGSHAGLLGGRCAMAVATTDRTAGGALPHVWSEIFDFCGIVKHCTEIFYDIRKSTQMQRQRWMDHVAHRAVELAQRHK